MAGEHELFEYLADLEQQAAAAFDAERAPEIADRSRAEYLGVTLVGRLMASLESQVTLQVTGVGFIAGRLERVAARWCLVAAPAQTWVVRLEAVAAVSGASNRAVPEMAWSPVAKLGVGSALRGLADDGRSCLVHRLDGTRHEGVLGRIGADFVEVRESEGEPARTLLVALAAIAAVTAVQR